MEVSLHPVVAAGKAGRSALILATVILLALLSIGIAKATIPTGALIEAERFAAWRVVCWEDYELLGFPNGTITWCEVRGRAVKTGAKAKSDAGPETVFITVAPQEKGKYILEFESSLFDGSDMIEVRVDDRPAFEFEIKSYGVDMEVADGLTPASLITQMLEGNTLTITFRQHPDRTDKISASVSLVGLSAALDAYRAIEDGN